MPSAGGWTPLPHDIRAGNPLGVYTANGAWEAGYYLEITQTAARVKYQLAAVGTLGDGDTLFLTQEIEFMATFVSATGTVDYLTQVFGSLGGTSGLAICLKAGSLGQVFARFTDANGATHDTPTWNSSITTRYVLGASVKRYLSGGSWVVDVTLRNIAGAVDLATLTADAIAGADKTAVFSQQASFGMATYTKSGTDDIAFGVAKVNYSSAVVLTAGNAWAVADVDNVKSRVLTNTALSPNVNLTAIGLLTIYDGSASGDGWPTTSTVISWRLPTSDSTPLQWAPDSGTTHYTQVDDAFGSYLATDYVTDTTAGHLDEYGYTALGGTLTGKTVLCVGLFVTGGNQCGPTTYLDFGGVISSAGNLSGLNANAGLFTSYWDKAPVAAAATGYAHTSVMMF